MLIKTKLKSKKVLIQKIIANRKKICKIKMKNFIFRFIKFFGVKT